LQEDVCETINLREFGGPPAGGNPNSTRKVETHNTGTGIVIFAYGNRSY